MHNLVVSIVCANGPAPVGARPSAGTVMTKSTYRLYTCARSAIKSVILEVTVFIMGSCRSFYKAVWSTKPYSESQLTHLPLVPHICVIETGQHWCLFGAKPLNLNQCWVIVNCSFGNKLQWNFNQNTEIFIYGNASENIVCTTTAMMSRGIWVN